MSEKDDKLNKGSFLYINDEKKAEWGYPEGYPKKSVQTTTLMEEQELAFASDASAEAGQYVAYLTNALDIVEGQTYTVNWDGTEYECVSFAFNENISMFGNKSIIGLGDNTDEPFIYAYNANTVNGGFTTLDTSASHTISVKTQREIVTPMAPEFLPAGVLPAGGSAFIVNVTMNDGVNYVADKTYAEISEALANGQIPYCIYGKAVFHIMLSDSLLNTYRADNSHNFLCITPDNLAITEIKITNNDDVSLIECGKITTTK